MSAPFKLEINTQTREIKRIELTDAEITLTAINQATHDAAIAAFNAEQARKDARQAKLDALTDKLEADPTLIDRIR